VINRLSKQ